MKGIVFELLEEFVIDALDADAYERALERCELRTTEPFVGPGTYPDTDLVALASAAADELAMTLPELLRAFGEHAFLALAVRLAPLVDRSPDAKRFLQSVDRVVHVEVHKLYTDAVTPSIECTDRGPGRLDLRYTSPRALCSLVEGFLAGVGRHYATKIEWHHAECTRDGDGACLFELRLTGPEGPL